MDNRTERQIARLAYAGNYEKAIYMLLDIVKNQDERISILYDKINGNTRGEIKQVST